MSEYINTYKLDHSDVVKPMERKKYYNEQKKVVEKTGHPTLAVGVFDVLLFTFDKEMIVQKRSNDKAHNPRMIDKAVGGHIEAGFTPAYTAMVECVQELRVPAVVLQRDQNEHLIPTLRSLKKNLESVAVLEFIDNKIHIIDNCWDGKCIPTAKNVWLYFGVYGGPMKASDREASGILYYSIDNLKKEMELDPDLFTPDLHYLLKEYEKEINQFLKQLN
ncbi:MAG: hypothetical protein ABIH21_03550 [Patescibacteria group bacterium]